jgi:hypothetical protein
MPKPKKKNKSRGKKVLAYQPTTNYGPFAKLIADTKKCVYIIARIRGDKLFTLGTGFLVAPHRMITCNHVFNYSDEKKHEAGDVYLFVQRDEFGQGHRYTFIPVVDETLFFYSDIDSAVIYLPDNFYEQSGKTKNRYLKLSSEIRPLGTEVGIIGYPMVKILINDDNTDILVESIIIRTDRGILNTAYNVEGVVINEFTMSFNPGNSGGPIIDTSTGQVVAMVMSYNSVLLKYIKEDVPEEQQELVGQTEAVSAIRANYSQGVASASMVLLKDQHSIPFSK